MCLFCQFNALSVVFLKPMGCVKLGVISVYVNLQYRNGSGLVLPWSEPYKTCLAPHMVHQHSRSPDSLPEQARTNKLRKIGRAHV